MSLSEIQTFKKDPIFNEFVCIFLNLKFFTKFVVKENYKSLIKNKKISKMWNSDLLLK